MSWRWDHTNMLWQAAQNPLQFLDAAYAKSWYAQHSAANWQSGGALNRLTAILQDAAGGYVTTWTGAPASNAQAWWGVGLSVPSFAFSGPARTGVTFLNTWRGISSALYSSTNSLLGGQQISGVQGTMQVIGLGGSLAGQIGGRWPAGIIVGQGGQLAWRFASEASIRTAQTLTNISQSTSAFRFGNRIGDAINHNLNSPLGASSPKVGGILFENCAATLTEIGELAGAYWDADTGGLVLVGRDSATGKRNSLPLPGLDQEHFVVALRAALAGQPLGVSIDPPAEFRDGIKRGVTPPDGTPMLVSYLGRCEGTLFGAILFEADRLLKCLDKGFHNETRKPVRATVPGFQPLLEMARPGDERENVWHRFWFVVEKVELKHDASASAVVFGDVRLKVLSETEMAGRPGTGFVDSNDCAFALHLTEHYDQYARDFPILARLKELAKITAIAKLLANQRLPLDLGTLFLSQPFPTATPSCTPGISVTSPHVETFQVGNGIHTRTVSMFGGVDMDPEPVLLEDRLGEARAMRRRTEATRPASISLSWSISEQESFTRAVGISLGKPRSPFSRACDDHQFSANRTCDVLRLCRVYDSTCSTDGDFGRGWKLWTPRSLTVLSSSGKRSEVLTQVEAQSESPDREILLLQNHTSKVTSLYRPVHAVEGAGSITFARVTDQRVNHGKVSFRYDSTDLIHKVKDGYQRNEDGQSYLFGPQGRLQEIQQDGRWIARYQWRDAFPARIEDAYGNWYEITANALTGDRIAMVHASDGTMLQYIYDQQGCLRSCHNGISDSETYAYDLQQRLTEVRDPLSRVVARTVYASDDSQVVSPTDLVLTEEGSKIWRTLNQGRLMQVRDELGGKATFEYGTKQELSGIRISDERGRTWRFAYDACGWLASFEDSTSQITQFEHTTAGQLNRVGTPRGESFSLEWDSSTRLVGWREASGQKTRLSYDDSGRLIEICAPNSRRWGFTYAGPMLLRASGPDEAVSISPRKQSLTVKNFCGDGRWEEQTFDRKFRLVKSKSLSGAKARFTYDLENNSSGIENEAGVLRYYHHPDWVTVEM